MDYLKWYVEEVMLPVFSPRQPAHICTHGNDWLACPQCDASYQNLKHARAVTKDAVKAAVRAAQESCQHQWLRPDNGVMECASCGATRYHYGD